MTHQLIAGTYCVFPTANKCKAAFERAKELGLPIFGDYGKGDTILVWVESLSIVSMYPEYEPDENEISHTELLARMEGTWEKPQLTLPEAITKLEGEGWKQLPKSDIFRTDGNRFEIEGVNEKYSVYDIRASGTHESELTAEHLAQLAQAIEACETLNNAK